MKREQPLDAWLADVARADREIEPPPDLEARTLAAWDTWSSEQSASPIRHSRFQPWAPAWMVPAFAGIAAAILLGLVIPRSDTGLVRLGGARVSQAADTPSPDAAGEVSSPRPTGIVAREPDESAVGAVAAIRRRPPGERAVKHRAPRPPAAIDRPRSIAAAPAVETASFVALGPDVERELTGTFQLARVQVSRDVLVDLGLLLDGHRGGEPVQAEVVFGEDGMARAIRLTPIAVSAGRTP